MRAPMLPASATASENVGDGGVTGNVTMGDGGAFPFQATSAAATVRAAAAR